MEQSLLGGMLLDNLAYHNCKHIIDARHFFEEEHRAIFWAIQYFIENERTIACCFNIPKVGVSSQGYLNSIATTIPIRPDSAEGFAKHLADLWRRRAGIGALKVYDADLRDPKITLDDARENFQQNLGRIAPLSCELSPAGIFAARWVGQQPVPLRFAIDDLVPIGMVTLLTSAGGAGKTLYMQQIGSAIACGCTQALGKSCVSGKAAGVFAEDPDRALHLRQEKINRSLNITMQFIADRYAPISTFGMQSMLWTKGAPTRFCHDLVATVAKVDRIRILTLDNAAILFGGDENDRSQVTQFMGYLNKIADEMNIAIVLASHASKTYDKKSLYVSSGSTAWVNASRSVLQLSRTDSGLLLTLVKANHAAPGIEIPLRWARGILST